MTGTNIEAAFGDSACIDSWMQLVRKVGWNYPGLETEESLAEHKQTVLKFMSKKQALCVINKESVVGVLLFSRNRNMICCLAVDPEHRKQGLASILLKKALMNWIEARKSQFKALLPGKRSVI